MGDARLHSLTTPPTAVPVIPLADSPPPYLNQSSNDEKNNKGYQPPILCFPCSFFSKKFNLEQELLSILKSNPTFTTPFNILQEQISTFISKQDNHEIIYRINKNKTKELMMKLVYDLHTNIGKWDLIQQNTCVAIFKKEIEVSLGINQLKKELKTKDCLDDIPATLFIGLFPGAIGGLAGGMIADVAFMAASGTILTVAASSFALCLAITVLAAALYTYNKPVTQNDSTLNKLNSLNTPCQTFADTIKTACPAFNIFAPLLPK